MVKIEYDVVTVGVLSAGVRTLRGRKIMQAEPTFLASTDFPPVGGAIRIRIPRGQQHLDLVGFLTRLFSIF